MNRASHWFGATSPCPPSCLPSHSLGDGSSRRSAQHDGGTPPTPLTTRSHTQRLVPPAGRRRIGRCNIIPTRDERKRREWEVVPAQERGPRFHTSPTAHPSDPGNVPRALCSKTSQNARRTLPPGKRPDAATSAMPPGSRCLRPCKPAGLSAVSSCRRSQETRPPAFSRPRTPFNWLVAESQFRGVPRRSAEMSSLLRLRVAARRQLPEPSQQPPLRRQDTRPPLPPHAGFLPQSRQRDLPAENRHTIQDALFLTPRETPVRLHSSPLRVRNALARFPQAFQMQCCQRCRQHST